MTGLYAAVSSNGRASALLDAVLQAAGTHQQLRRFDSDHCAVALLLPESISPCLWHVDANRCVAVHGQLDSASDCKEDVLNELDARGPATLGGWDGLYHGVCWDQKELSLSVATDGTGSLPFFSARVDSGCVVASAPGPLLSWRQADPLDRAGLLSLLSIGFQMDQRTIRTSVNALPPLSLTTVSCRLGALAIQHQRCSKLPEPRGEIGHAICASLKTLNDKKPTLLALTGGIDSNALLCASNQQELKFQAVTVDSGQRSDVHAATHNARVTAVPHTVVSSDESISERDLFALKSAISSTSDWNFATLLPLYKRAQSRSLLLGFLGGTFGGAFADCGDQYIDAIAPQKHFSYAHSLSKPELHWCSPTCDSPDSSVLNRGFAANLYGRQRRYTSGMVRLAAEFCTPVCPYARRDVIAAALRYSTLGAKRQALVSELKDFGALINGNDGLPMGSGRRRSLHGRLRGTKLSSAVRRAVPFFPGGYDAERLTPVVDNLAQDLPQSRRLFLENNACSVYAKFSLMPLLLDESQETMSMVKELWR